MKYDAIILVAGSGKRMRADKNKVLLSIGGQAIFKYSLDLFLSDEDCQSIILVGQKKDRISFEPYLSQQVSFVEGGKERQDSVRLGLDAVTSEHVMIHDGARPFVQLNDLKALKKEKNAILAVPVKDTIKAVSSNVIKKTIPREPLYQAQTPQFFQTDLIKTAHKSALQDHFQGTDDASLVEKYSSADVKIVLGSYFNLKLTTPEDLILGEAIIQQYKEVMR